MIRYHITVNKCFITTSQQSNLCAILCSFLSLSFSSGFGFVRPISSHSLFWYKKKIHCNIKNLCKSISIKDKCFELSFSMKILTFCWDTWVSLKSSSIFCLFLANSLSVVPLARIICWCAGICFLRILAMASASPAFVSVWVSESLSLSSSWESMFPSSSSSSSSLSSLSSSSSSSSTSLSSSASSSWSTSDFVFTFEISSSLNSAS